MKKTLVTHQLSLLLLIAFLGIFIIGGAYSNYMTHQISVHIYGDNTSLNREYLGMFPDADNVYSFDTTPVAVSYTLPDYSGSFIPVLNGSYSVYKGDTQVGVIYVVISHGKYPGLEVAYAIDFSTNSCINTKVISKNETPEYYNRLGSSFFNQFENLVLDSGTISVDSVAGSTYSSKGIEIGMKYAQAQYISDFLETPTPVALTVNSVTYNFDLATFISYPYIADVTFGTADSHSILYLNSSFTVSGVISGNEPDATTKTQIKALASTTSGLIKTAHFVSYTDSTRTLVMSSVGYVSTPIQVTLVFSSDFSTFTYTVNSHETYSNRDNSHYTGAAVPAVENYYLNQYLLGTTPIDAVAGASVGTSPGMQKLIDLLDLFIQARLGGN